MKIPDWLSEELAGTGWIFRTTMSAGLCMTAGTVLWTTFTGETALEVAYPLFAFVSSGLLGVGLIRTGGVNVPAALGCQGRRENMPLGCRRSGKMSG